jgi:hypothetical protein
LCQKEPEGDKRSQKELKGAKRSQKDPKGANRSQLELKEAKGSLESQLLSKVDKWSHREAFEAIRNHWVPYGVKGAIGSHIEPMEAI